MRKSSLLLVLMVILSIVTVQGFIIDEHATINRQSLEKASTSPLAQEIKGYEDYFYVCDELVDISIATYFEIDSEVTDTWFDKFVKTFTFNIGKPYRATHDPSTCLNALPEARNMKEKACGYGICAHQMQDSPAHNKLVPEAIRQTGLSNGMVHAPVEVYVMNKLSSPADHAKSREVLDLSYEMTPYLTKVFSANPSFKNLDIAELVDFFVRQVQPDSQYKLGFQSFFALPQWIYWLVFFLFLIGVALLALAVRKLLDGEVNVLTIFSAGFAFLIFTLTTLVIYGLATGNIWGIWLWLSQVLFSYWMYPLAFISIIGGFWISIQWFMKGNRWVNIGNLMVGVLILVLGIWMLTLPNALNVGNYKAIHDEAVSNTVNLLVNGVSVVRGIPDPSGYASIRDAEAVNAVSRTSVLVFLAVVLVGILYLAFKPRKKSERRLLV